MKDLNINITGPTGQATQRVSFTIHDDHRSEGLDPKRIMDLVGQLRSELTGVQISRENARRLERHLEAIDEEARAQQPNWGEVKHAVGFVARIVESAGKISQSVVATLQGLAAAVGLTLGA